MKERSWYWLAALVSALSIGVVGSIWKDTVHTYKPRDNQLASQDAVQQLIAAHQEHAKGAEPAVLVPTGVFVQSLSFLNASDVNITGYIWQKYANDIPEDISRGFVLPEQVDSSSTVIEKAYQRLEEGFEVIGWYFDVTVRQPFDYSKYPLDRHEIWLRLWHQDFDRNIILTPDLQAYDSTRFGEVFGVDRELVPGGWNMEETFFRYQNGVYDTDFGIADYVGQHDFPELYFSIVVSRDFANAFVINLVPLLIVSALLFAVLMMLTEEQAAAERFGLTTMEAIATASALFFVVMLSHIQLRKEFPGTHIVYLEYFYLVTYVAILLTSLNAFLFAAGEPSQFRWVKYRNNFLVKMTFWPALLGTLALITAFKL
jgi:hypothetical protein